MCIVVVSVCVYCSGECVCVVCVVSVLVPLPIFAYLLKKGISA